MSFASLPPSSSASAAGSAAKTALILALQLEDTSSLSAIPKDAAFSLADFVAAWRSCVGKPLLCSPVEEIEALDDVARSNNLRAQTLGLFGHRFVTARARCFSPERPEGADVFIRVDFWAEGMTVKIHDTRQGLVDEKSTALVMKLSAPSSSASPSLDAFVALLDEVGKRTPAYNVTVSNCLSFTERIMFVSGKKYANHWCSATNGVHPQILRAYINGEMDEIDAGVAVGVPEGAGRVVSQVALRAVKGAQTFFTSWLPREQQVRWPGQDVHDILEAWEPRTPAEL